MRNALTPTLCAGASSAVPLLLPILNSPAGSEIMATPERVTISTGPLSFDPELAEAPADFVPRGESGSDFPHAVRSAAVARAAPYQTFRVTVRSRCSYSFGTKPTPCCSIHWL